MKPLAVIVGPTASGKSAVALEVAKKLGGEIVSADSVQVYRGLDIGSAKPGFNQRQEVPHHLIDIVDPDYNYTVADFQRDARAAIDNILSRGRLPVLAGGTGLYIRAVIRGYCFSAGGEDLGLRQRLWDEAQRQGPQALYLKLASIDKEAAARIHPNDLRRVIRALEVFASSKTLISEQIHLTSGRCGYDARLFGLTMPRELLYRRIEERVERMLGNGLVDEVKRLLDAGVSPHAKSMQSLGYRQIIAFLQGKIGLNEAVELIKRDTRRFAKRQLTWFRREQDVTWLDVAKAGGESVVAEKICELLAGDYRFKENTSP